MRRHTFIHSSIAQLVRFRTRLIKAQSAFALFVDALPAAAFLPTPGLATAADSFATSSLFEVSAAAFDFGSLFLEASV